MKKTIMLILLFTLLMTGCNKEMEIQSIDEVEVDDLFEYKGTDFGDNSGIGLIISALPGGETYRGFELNNGNAIKVVYGVREGSSITDEVFSDYWLNNDTIERNFLYNAFAMFVLIENLQEVTFEVDSTKGYTVSFERDKLMQEMPNSLESYKGNAQLWEKEWVDKKVNSATERNNVFKKFPMQIHNDEI